MSTRIHVRIGFGVIDEPIFGVLQQVQAAYALRHSCCLGERLMKTLPAKIDFAATQHNFHQKPYKQGFFGFFRPMLTTLSIGRSMRQQM